MLSEVFRLWKTALGVFDGVGIEMGWWHAVRKLPRLLAKSIRWWKVKKRKANPNRKNLEQTDRGGW